MKGSIQSASPFTALQLMSYQTLCQDSTPGWENSPKSYFLISLALRRDRKKELGWKGEQEEEEKEKTFRTKCTYGLVFLIFSYSLIYIKVESGSIIHNYPVWLNQSQDKYVLNKSCWRNQWINKRIKIWEYINNRFYCHVSIPSQFLD